MSEELDFSKPGYQDTAQQFGVAEPTAMHFKKGEVKRLMFLGNKLKLQLVYNVRHATEKDPKNEERNRYVGTFKSLTQEKRQLSTNKILKAIRDQNFDDLEIDAKVLGKPDVNSGVLALVYHTDAEGNVDKDYFKKGVFSLGWFKMSQKRYEDIVLKIDKRLNNSGKNIFQVDFLVELDGEERFQKIKIEPQDKSLYLTFKDKLGFEKIVQKKVQEEMQKYGFAHPADWAQLFGRDLTEQGWVQMLLGAGYDLTPYGIEGSSTSTPPDGDVPSNPELEGDLDFGENTPAA